MSTEQKTQPGSLQPDCSASDPFSRQGILNAKTDRDKVNAAWARVLALGERLESVAQARHELLCAVKEAVAIEKETGEYW